MSTRIPKTLHLCFGFSPDFGGKPFGLSHFASIRSAIERIKPAEAFLYFQYEPDSVWWRETARYVTLVQIDAPTEIFGRELTHPAHRADVVRLEKLLDHGGIYLDCDVIVQKSLDDLLAHSVVLGRQGARAHFGLANAVMLAEPGAPFLQRWFDAYSSFRGTQTEHWDEHSCLLPLYLSRRHPNEITVLPHSAFFYPMWTASHIEWVFNSYRPVDLSDTYVNHFWESRAWRYLRHLTPGDVRRADTNFHRWIRPYVRDYADDFGADRQVAWESRAPSSLYLLGESIAQRYRDFIRNAFPPSELYLARAIDNGFTADARGNATGHNPATSSPARPAKPAPAE